MTTWNPDLSAHLADCVLSPDEVRIAQHLQPELPIVEEGVTLQLAPGYSIKLTLLVYGEDNGPDGVDIKRVTLLHGNQETNITAALQPRDMDEVRDWIEQEILQVQGGSL
jgi:hypothetical protein